MSESLNWTVKIWFFFAKEIFPPSSFPCVCTAYPGLISTNNIFLEPFKRDKIFRVFIWDFWRPIFSNFQNIRRTKDKFRHNFLMMNSLRGQNLFKWLHLLIRQIRFLQQNYIFLKVIRVVQKSNAFQ